MKKFSALLVSMIACFCVFFCAPIAQASSNTDSIYFKECNDSAEQITCTIVLIFNWLAIGVSTIVVIMVIVGAIQYMTAGGSKEGTKKAIETIRNAIIALVLYMVMWVFLNWLVPGGALFGGS